MLIKTLAIINSSMVVVIVVIISARMLFKIVVLKIKNIVKGASIILTKIV